MTAHDPTGTLPGPTCSDSAPLELALSDATSCTALGLLASRPVAVGWAPAPFIIGPRGGAHKRGREAGGREEGSEGGGREGEGEEGGREGGKKEGEGRKEKEKREGGRPWEGEGGKECGSVSWGRRGERD